MGLPDTNTASLLVDLFQTACAQDGVIVISFLTYTTMLFAIPVYPVCFDSTIYYFRFHIVHFHLLTQLTLCIPIHDSK